MTTNGDINWEQAAVIARWRRAQGMELDEIDREALRRAAGGKDVW